MKYQYLAERSRKELVKVTCPADLLPLLKRYQEYEQEAFIAVSLDGGHQVTNVRLITIGILNRTLIHPREIFVGAIQDRAAALILCHNHPSGNPEPSREDREITGQLVEAGKLLSIPVLDHIIITKDREYYSFLETGEI